MQSVFSHRPSPLTEPDVASVPLAAKGVAQLAACSGISSGDRPQHGRIFRFESAADAAKLPAGEMKPENDPWGGPLNGPMTEVAP
jgi:hypothetical protein